LDSNLKHLINNKNNDNKLQTSKINLKSKNMKQKIGKQNTINKEIDFEVNKILKEEIVDLKLELDELKREKSTWENLANQKSRTLLEQKQNLEKINVDINKGKYKK